MKTSTLAVFALVGLAGAAAPASAELVFGVTRDNRLVSFDHATPGTILSNVAISGLNSGENVLGIDARPTNIPGQLVIMTSGNRLLTLGADGTATAIGTGFPTALSGAIDFGIDFNPTVDRIRVVDTLGGNRRLNPVTGGEVAPSDTALTFAPGDVNTGTPSASGTAYRNWFFSGTNMPAGSVRQYIIDTTRGILGEVGSMAGGNASFNGGVVTTIGNLGFTSTIAGFDIFGPTDLGLVAGDGAGSGTTLYSLNFNTGAATAIGTVGDGSFSLRDFTIVPAPSAAALLGLAGLAAARRRR